DFSLDLAGNPTAPGYLHNPFVNDGVNSNTAFLCDGARNSSRAAASGVDATGVRCNKILNSLINSVAGQMVQLYPLPNTNQPQGNYINAPARKTDENSFDIRADHNFSSKDSIFARFSYDDAAVFIPGGSPGFAEPDAFGSTQNIENHGRNAAISETHIFSPNTINQFSAGYNRIFNHIASLGNGMCKSQELGIPGANLGGVRCGLTSTIVGGGFWSLGDRGFAPFQGGTNVFSISESFDMIRGHHNIRIGGQVRANQMNVETNAFQDGFFINFGFSGDATADVLLGQMGGMLHDQTYFGATTGRRWKLFRPYIQDAWRVTPNLTLNIGVAWALVTPITEAQGRQSNYDIVSSKMFVAGPADITGCTFCVRSDGRVGIQMDKTAVEPRIGIAWKPFGMQNTAVRAGYAIFHDSSWNQGAQGLWENPPYFADYANF